MIEVAEPNVDGEGDIGDGAPGNSGAATTPPLNEQEVEAIFKRELDERLKHLMSDFEKELGEVTSEAKKKIDEIAPAATKSPKAKKWLLWKNVYYFSLINK